MKTPRGFTLVELLIAIALILLVLGGLGALFLSEAQRRTCAEQLGRVQDAARLYQANRNDQILCRNLKSLTERYNERCGEDLGRLDVPACG